MAAKTDSDVRDVLILGAGPAGAAAALWAAQGLKVEVCERADSPGKEVRLEWLNKATYAELIDAGVPAREAVIAVIDRVRFFEPALAKNTVTPLDEPIELVEVGRLADAMLRVARDVGVSFNGATTVTDIEIGEDLVSLHCESGRRFAGRILIFAGGADASPTVPGFSGVTENAPLSSACEWRSSTRPPRPAAKGDPEIELSIFLESRDPGTYGYAYAVRDLQVVGLVGPVGETKIRSEFERHLGRWASAGLLDGADVSAKQAAIRSVPRGAALEMESHVGKRAILIGDAGGFVAALGHDGIHAAIRSARIAVDVCRAALESKQPQDALAEFDLRWRHELVEYLRLPNTDLRFLVPLIFTNELMAKRLAGAFLAGTNL